MQIYTVPDSASTGPNPDQFRDCEDIAVKLAFALNSIIEIPKVTFSLEKQEKAVYVSDLSVIQSITNLYDTNRDLIPNHRILPLRIKQSSDLRLASSICKLEKKLKIQKEVLKTLKHEVEYNAADKAQVSLLEKFKYAGNDGLELFIKELKLCINDNIAKLGFLPEDPLSKELVSVDILGVEESAVGIT